MTRKQSIKHWRKILSRQEASKYSLPEFCRNENLNYKTALKYRHIIDAMSFSEKRDPKSEWKQDKSIPAVNFLELPSPGASNEESPEGIRLELDNGVKLELPSGFDRGRFVQIVQLLCEDAAC